MSAELPTEATLSAIDVDASPSLMADWLELRAFMSLSGRAQISDLQSQQDLERDYESTDISEEQEELEDLAARVTAAIEHRTAVLEGAYPFTISDDGRVVHISDPENWGVGEVVYLFSLILAHSPKSEIVPRELAPTDPELISARDVFQICATLAAAGQCGGPAFSLGWPRPDSSAFLEKLREIWRVFGDGTPVAAPRPGSPTKVKDEGIDVVAWCHQPDGQARTMYVLGQVASGNDWQGKSVKDSIDVFHGEWFQTHPASPPIPAIFIPFMVEDVLMQRHTRRFGHVLHRGRLPRLAAKAPELAKAGTGPIERLDEVAKIGDWLRAHRHRLLAIEAQ